MPDVYRSSYRPPYLVPTSRIDSYRHPPHTLRTLIWHSGHTKPTSEFDSHVLFALGSLFRLEREVLSMLHYQSSTIQRQDPRFHPRSSTAEGMHLSMRGCPVLGIVDWPVRTELVSGALRLKWLRRDLTVDSRHICLSIPAWCRQQAQDNI